MSNETSGWVLQLQLVHAMENGLSPYAIQKSDTIGNAVQSQLSQSVTDTNNRATMDDVASHGCPVTKSNDETIVATTGSTAAAGCPVTTKSTEYNVYAQPIDPTNNIPRTVNQLPAAIQTKVLSTERVASSIPKVRDKAKT